MTEKQFWIAMGVRDYYQKRLRRFNNNKPLEYETPEHLRRAMRIDKALTDFIGDGMMVKLTWNAQLAANG